MNLREAARLHALSRLCESPYSPEEQEFLAVKFSEGHPLETKNEALMEAMFSAGKDYGVTREAMIVSSLSASFEIFAQGMAAMAELAADQMKKIRDQYPDPEQATH